MIFHRIFAALMAATLAFNAFAWSQKGHDTVAYIAEKHFTAATADSVAALLDGMSPVYWANWLDNASHQDEYAYTKTWHYKNIDEGIAYEDAPLNEAGDVVRAVEAQIVVLSDDAASREDKVLAMKILIHCVGDMHQPMHMGRLSDLGGNNVKVRFFNRDNKLHAVWDSSIMNSGHSWSYTEWQQQLDRLSPEAEAAEIAGDVDDWAEQTHVIAQQVYAETPEWTSISYDEVARWTPVIEKQLLRGGLRLAHLLNMIYDGRYAK